MTIGVLVSILIVAIALMTKLKEEENISREPYDNPIIESVAVKLERFNDNYIFLRGVHRLELIDKGVSNFQIIMENTKGEISEEHTKAIENNFLVLLDEKLEKSDFSAEEKEWFAASMTSIIWESLLEEVEKLTVTEEVVKEPKYMALANNLKKEILTLDNKLSTMKITARVNMSDVMEKIDTDQIASDVEGKLANSDSWIEKIGSVIENKIRDTLSKEIQDDMKDGLVSEISKIVSGQVKDGKDGRDGKDGQTGPAGKDGAAGKDGQAGQDGMNAYIVYSEYENGKTGTGVDSISEKPTDKTKYMGTVMAKEKPTSAAQYSWSKYVGEDGKDGLDGIAGKDGQDGLNGENVYLVYSEYENGKDALGMDSFLDTPQEGMKYIGTATALKKPSSADEYIWSKYIGEDGRDGQDGQAGKDGAAGKDGLNAYIVYSKYSNGKNLLGQDSFTNAPEMESKYMGTAVAESKPTDAAQYEWTQYKEISIEYQNIDGKPTVIFRR